MQRTIAAGRRRENLLSHIRMWGKRAAGRICAAFVGCPGLWLKGQASYGQKVPRKLIRKAVVIMA